MVERGQVPRLELEGEAVAQDRLGEAAALLEVARALLVLDDQALELGLHLRDPPLDPRPVGGVLGDRAPDLERGQTVAQAVAPLPELERRGAGGCEQRAGDRERALHGGSAAASGSRSNSTE